MCIPGGSVTLVAVGFKSRLVLRQVIPASLKPCGMLFRRQWEVHGLFLAVDLFWKSMQGMTFPLRRCWQGSISKAERAFCTGDGLSISGRCLPSYHLSEELHELSHNVLSEHTTLFISVSPFYRGEIETQKD